MEHIKGKSVKKIEDLCIQDFIPTAQEKDYLFTSLVYYYSRVLVDRFPEMFRSLNSSVKANKAHQFEKEMALKSDEYSGDLFTRSESNTEDLVYMMEEVQDSYVHKYVGPEKEVECFERKVLSGDNKTEKISHYGIIR